MIKLNRNGQPDVLLKNSKVWTDTYLKGLKMDGKPPSSVSTNYNKPEIKNQLRKDAFDKCVYCEMRVRPVGWGEVDHILPKNKKPELVFDWENLTLACSRCNNNKSDYMDEKCLLINPFIDDPAAHLIAVGHLIFQNASERGQATVDIIDLNRSKLREAREERIIGLSTLVSKWQFTTNPQHKEALKRQIQIQIEDKNEFSFVLRTMVSFATHGTIS